MSCDIEVRVVQARGLMTGEKQPPSPYGQVIVGDQKKKTKTVKTTTEPVFNEPFTIDIGDAASFVIEIHDKTAPGNKSFLGQVTIPVNGLKLDSSNNWFPLKENPKAKKKAGVKGDVLLQFAVPAPIGKPPSSSEEKQMKQTLQAALEQKVTALNLEALHLQGMPKEVYEKFLSTTEFNLGFNKFSDWPDFTPFSKLQIVNLSGNKLTSIGASIASLKSLKELYLNGNNLKIVPPELGHCVKLEKLNLANNQIRRIADEIGYLTKLEELTLTGNPVTSLPPTIGECHSIEIMDLSCCELVSLPEQFTFMTRMLELNLGSNKLSSLPDTIGRMTRLAVLNLSDNNLEDLPLSLGLCYGLGKLGAGINLDRNPIKSSDMLKKWKIGTDHLVDFLEKRYDKANRPALKQVTPVKLPSLDPPSESPQTGGKGSTQQQQTSSNATAAKPVQQQQQQGGGGGSFLNTPAVQSAPAVQNSSQPDPMAEKIKLLAAWTKNTIGNEMIPKLNGLIQKVTTTPSFDEALGVGQLANDMKAEFGKIKALVQGCGVTPPSPIAADTTGKDKVGVLKITTANALKEVISLLEAVTQAVDHGTQQQVIALVQVVKGMNARLT